MTKDEALKLALTVLESYAISYDDGDEAIAAIKEALAQQQEPVAMRYDFDGYGWKYIDSGSGSDWKTRIKGAESIYTSPPAIKPWVGLTDEDKQIAFDDTQEGGGFWEFADAIEAKLKEKNNG
jgi:hypothetical protein